MASAMSASCVQGRNFGLKSEGINSGEKVALLATETKREFSGGVRSGAPAENGFSVI